MGGNVAVRICRHEMQSCSSCIWVVGQRTKRGKQERDHDREKETDLEGLTLWSGEKQQKQNYVHFYHS